MAIGKLKPTPIDKYVKLVGEFKSTLGKKSRIK